MKFIKILSLSVLSLAVTAAIAAPTVIKKSAGEPDCAGLASYPVSGVWFIYNKCQEHYKFTVTWTNGFPPTTTNCLEARQVSFTHYLWGITYPSSATQAKC